MNWFNAEEQTPPLPLIKKAVFGTGHRQSYPLEWEDVTLLEDLRALAEADTRMGDRLAGYSF